jgi:NAD(P)-dependent dehydrogenase (short-subunit alcohol dehydrogenase family)
VSPYRGPPYAYRDSKAMLNMCGRSLATPGSLRRRLQCRGIPVNAIGVARGIITLVAVYRTDPVMVVGETADGALLERSPHELADGHERLPPRLWQERVMQYQGPQIS